MKNKTTYWLFILVIFVVIGICAYFHALKLERLECIRKGQGFPMSKEPSRHRVRASLVAQWLRICLPMQGTRV